MLNKLISSVLLSCSFMVMPITGKQSASLLFLFISPNKWISTIRLALALSLFFISFKTFSRYFDKYQKLRSGLVTAGLIMIGFGLFSTLEASLGSFFYDYLKPLDLMIILEAGIITTGLGLTTLPKSKTVQKRTKTQKTTPKLRQKPA